MPLRIKLAKRLMLAQVLDVVTFAAFVYLVPISIEAERNPFIALAFGMGGIVAVAAVKGGLAYGVAFASVYSKTVWDKPFERSFTVVSSTATASGLVGTGFNVAALVSAMVHA